MIGEIQEYTVDIDNNFVTIKADDVYQLNLKTQEISTTKKLDKERTLCCLFSLTAYLKDLQIYVLLIETVIMNR